MDNINEVLKKMTAEEKASLSSGASMFETAKVERLGIPSIKMCDGPHGLRLQKESQDFLGVALSEKETALPCLALAACSFDKDLLYKYGEIIAGNYIHEKADIILGPGVNIKRSPLGGRNFEYFSEDPYLSGKLGASYIKGAQSKGIGCCLKHFALNNQETRRRTSSSFCDERTANEIYLKAFDIAIHEANPYAIMSSYNKIDNVYASENKKLLTDLLVKKWGYEGAVISDWTAVHDRVAALNANCNLTMPGDKANDIKITDAYNKGLISEETLNNNTRKMLELVNKCKSVNKTDDYDYEKAHEEVVNIAQQCIVLLKNEDNILPLKTKKKVALIGKLANETRFGGEGSSKVNPYKLLKATEVCPYDFAYAEGYPLGQSSDEKLHEEAVALAKECDTVIFYAGYLLVNEGEGYDKWILKLPLCQIKLINDIAKVNKNIIVVLENGCPVEMDWIGNVKAIVEAYLAGEGANEAIFNVISGKTNPSGRLAETFPLKLEDNPSYLYFPGEGNDTYYSEGLYVGYRYYTSKKQDVLFPFGYGLSYSSFEYSNLMVSKESISYDEKLEVSVDVTNTSSLKGKEVVQLYVGIKTPTGIYKRPVRELKGFEKTELLPNETKTVKFVLDKSAFAIYDTDIHNYRVPGGKYYIQIAKNANEVILEKEINVADEYVNKGITYSIMTPINEALFNPAGKKFLDKALPMMNAIISRMAVAKAGADMPYIELSDKNNMGLMCEPLLTLKRMLRNIPEEEWNKLIEEMNKC